MKPPFEYHARLMTFHPWQSCHLVAGTSLTLMAW